MGSKIAKQRTLIRVEKKDLRLGLMRHLLSLSIALNPLLLLVSFNVKVAAATISGTTVYIVEGTNTNNVKSIHSIDPVTGVLTSTIFNMGVTSTAAMALDSVNLVLYYVDRTTSPNRLKRYDGTSESGILATFPGTDSSNVILRMGFAGTTGYAIDSNNNAFSFTNTSPSTVTSLGTVNFYGISPSGSTSSGDIAFDGYGRGWAIFGNSLYRMDFNASPIVAYPIGQVSIGGTTLLSTSAYTVGSIAFAPSGALLIGAISGSDTTIYQVSMNDASAAKIGSTLSGLVISDFASGNAPNLNPNIVATKSVSPTGSVGPGDTLTYTIEVENTGNVPAVATTFTDALPAGTTYVANSATLNGTTLGAASYPFNSPYTINGRNASASALKVGNANRATISYQVTVNTVSTPAVVNNSGVVTYLDGPGGGVMSNQTSTNINSIIYGYKSVKLTNDADNNGAITPGDTLTWTTTYTNTSSLAAPNFQLNDPLPTGVTVASTGGQTVTTSGSGTTASKNPSYTGASAGAVSDLLAAGATLGANGVITVSIPTIVNAGFSGTVSNQAHATGSTVVTGGVYSDNVDATTGGLPSGVTVPAGSVVQTQGAGTDPTTAIVKILVIISGQVWGDVDNSANNTFTNINTGAETGTNAGGLVAVLADAGNNVITSTAVNSDGTYSFNNVLGNQSNVTIRLALSSGAMGTGAPAAVLPAGWTNTSPLITTAFNIVISNITGRDFGIERLPTPAATNPASQTNPGGTTLITVPSTHFTGTDPDGTVASFKFTAFPPNATSITINGTNYTSGTFPAGGVSVAASSGALPANMVSVDPVDGSVTVGIPFTVTDNAGKESASTATVSTVFALAPNITLVKNCTSPATCLTATQPPGTDLTYNITLTNDGGSSAQSLVIADPIPSNTDFKLGSVTTNLGASGLTVAIEYSNDYNASSPGSATWNYTPSSGSGGASSGYDRNVKAVRWRVTAGNLSPTAPNNTADIGFTVKIR